MRGARADRRRVGDDVRVSPTEPTGTATAADATRIAFNVGGQGPPLVLLSGQSTDHQWWDAVLPDFTSHFTTIAVDHRGTGASDRPRIGYSTATLADDVISVLDRLGIDRAHLYGTSMGGRVAQQASIRHPERVDHLVLGCTSPGGSGSVERSSEVREQVAQDDRAAGRRFLLDLMYTPAWWQRNPGPYPVLGDPSMSPRDRRFHRLASDGHDAWDSLAGITAPTLIVHGSDDLMNPTANAALMADRIDGSRLAVIPGARHAYFEEFRHVASPLVVGFLTDTSVPKDC